jgi:hypothetical protein
VEAEKWSERQAQLFGLTIGDLSASFPALKPSQATSFRCYLRTNAGGADGELAEFAVQPTFIAGEADSVEFFSLYEETRKAQSAGCR